MNTVLVAIALGSNVANRDDHIRDALARISQIPQTSVLRSSPPIETAPVGPSNAELGGPYLNAAAVLETALAPRTLLLALLRIELDMGRVRRVGEQCAPRTIDLDLILYADQVIREPGLEIPHPRMHLRRFVLDPLAHIAPDWVVPTLGRTVVELFIALPPDPPDLPVPPGPPANNPV